MTAAEPHSWIDRLNASKRSEPSSPRRSPDDVLPVRRRWRHDARWIVAPQWAHDPERLDLLVCLRPVRIVV